SCPEQLTNLQWRADRSKDRPDVQREIFPKAGGFHGSGGSCTGLGGRGGSIDSHVPAYPHTAPASTTPTAIKAACNCNQHRPSFLHRPPLPPRRVRAQKRRAENPRLVSS